MHKGFFTQCVCLLTNGSTTISATKAAVEAGGFRIAKELPAGEHWEFGGPSIVIPYRPQVSGSVRIDVVQHPWPDEMTDSESAPKAFGAWCMGFFGPLAYPGGLARAVQHSHGWQAGRLVAPKHRGVIRMRITYVTGLSPSEPILPKDHDPLAELTFLNRLVLAAASAPGILCYFNPNGEVLRDVDSFLSICGACAREKKLPLLLWSNSRLFSLDGPFGFMDTVGNGQFDKKDIEVIYPTSRYDPRTIAYYMGNVTHHLLDLKRELRTGEPFDGPGESNFSWVAELRDQGVASPPRKVVRLCPTSDVKAIRESLAAVTAKRTRKSP